MKMVLTPGTHSKRSGSKVAATPTPNIDRNERLSIGFNLVNQIFQPRKANLPGGLAGGVGCVLRDELTFGADWEAGSTLVLATINEATDKVVHVDLHATRPGILALNG